MNAVFEAAVATLSQLYASLESEVNRIDGLVARAAGVQQHIDALRVQERELQVTVNDLAAKIPATRQQIADAEAQAKKIVDDALRRRDQILVDARSTAQAEAKAAVAREADAMMARIRCG